MNSLVSILTCLPYFVETSYNRRSEVQSFISINSHNQLFTHRSSRLKMGRSCLKSEIIKKRATTDSVNFSALQEADLLLHYISCINKLDLENENGYPYWFPYLMSHSLYNSPSLHKLVSKRFFEKFKIVLGIESKEELEQRITKFESNNQNQTTGFQYRIPNIRRGLKIDSIGKYQ